MFSSINPLREKSAEVGFTRRIVPGAIAAGGTLQYDAEASEDMQSLLRRFGSANYIEIINNDTVDFEIVLDYSLSRTIDALAGTVVVMDDTMFQSFDVKNTSTQNASTAGKLKVVIGNLRPTAKSARIDGRRR